MFASHRTTLGGAIGAAALALAVITPQVAVAADNVTRISGTDRYQTAAALQAQLLPDAKQAFITTGTAFPDALAAGPAAAVSNGAILLTSADKLPQATSDALKTMNPEKIWIIGGKGAVSEQVAEQIKNLVPNAQMERIAGSDRYDTSSKIATQFFNLKADDKAPLRFIANGLNFPDALAGAALAGAKKAPLILTPNNPEAPILSFAKGPQNIVLGGPAVLSDAVANAAGMTERYAGNNRYVTSKVIMDKGFPGANRAIYASGLNFPDALAAVPAAAKNNLPLVLTGKNNTPTPVNLPGWVIGGPGAVADNAWNTPTPAPQPNPEPQQPQGISIEPQDDGLYVIKGADKIDFTPIAFVGKDKDGNDITAERKLIRADAKLPQLLNDGANLFAKTLWRSWVTDEKRFNTVLGAVDGQLTLISNPMITYTSSCNNQNDANKPQWCNIEGYKNYVPKDLDYNCSLEPGTVQEAQKHGHYPAIFSLLCSPQDPAQAASKLPEQVKQQAGNYFPTFNIAVDVEGVLAYQFYSFPGGKHSSIGID